MSDAYIKQLIAKATDVKNQKASFEVNPKPAGHYSNLLTIARELTVENGQQQKEIMKLVKQNQQIVETLNDIYTDRAALYETIANLQRWVERVDPTWNAPKKVEAE